MTFSGVSLLPKLLSVKNVRLICHHYAITVEQGEGWPTPVFCPQCAQHRRVVEVLKWGRVKCLSCKYAFKGRVDRAEAKAYAHSRDNTTHMVQCWEGPKLLFTATLARTQAELPLFELPPPF